MGLTRGIRRAAMADAKRHGFKVPGAEVEVVAEVIAIDNGNEILDLDRLTELENTIELGIKSLKNMGIALQEIRDSRLYRAEFSTFEAYLNDRWGLSQTRAWQLIQHSQVIANLEHEGVTNLPTSEYQTRHLYELPPKEQVTVWSSVLEETDKPTGAIVREKVLQNKPRPEPLGNSEQLPPSSTDKEINNIEDAISSPVKQLFKVTFAYDGSWSLIDCQGFQPDNDFRDLLI